MEPFGVKEVHNNLSLKITRQFSNPFVKVDGLYPSLQRSFRESVDNLATHSYHSKRKV